MAKDDKCCCGGGNPFVAIPSALTAMFLGLAVLLMIFAKDSLDLLVPIIWAFVVVMVVAMAFAFKASKKK
ncbi:MAG: hypothetical protein V1866_01110 [archaeon]